MYLINFFRFWKQEKQTQEIDKSILSKERQEYLEKAINMNEYITDLDEFCKKVNVFIAEKEWLNQRYEYCMQLLDDEIIENQQEKLILKNNV